MSARSYRILDDAADEFWDALDRYAAERRELAEDFRDKFDDAQAAVGRHPLMWSRHLAGTRFHHLKRFPYFLVYRVTDDEIVVVAVSHDRRRPGYWLDRLDD